MIFDDPHSCVSLGELCTLESVRIMDQGDDEQPSVDVSPIRTRHHSNNSSTGPDDDTDVAFEDDAEDFALPSAGDLEESPPHVEAGTSFTADSPYFDAFCQSEIASLEVLSTTLSEISMRAKIFSQTGAMMSQATQRLANACKLKHGGDDEDIEPSEHGQSFDNGLYDRRKKAIGDEMAGILELLGEVSFLIRFRLSAYVVSVLGV